MTRRKFDAEWTQWNTTVHADGSQTLTAGQDGFLYVYDAAACPLHRVRSGRRAIRYCGAKLRNSGADVSKWNCDGADFPAWCPLRRGVRMMRMDDLDTGEKVLPGRP